MTELPTPIPRQPTLRDRVVFADPRLWPAWPFLPVIRHRPDGGYDCGLLYDLAGLTGRTGYGAAVFLGNLFELPPTEAEFLALPREVKDSPEELADAGWLLD
jgi:hypothetical protein